MNTTLMALNPAAMTVAQSDLVLWCANKINEVTEELTSAESVMVAIQKAGMFDQRARHLVNRAKKRIQLYRKIKSALDAGYYIVPPFPVQSFAIRTNQETPPAKLDNRRWQNAVSAPSLPIGEGEFRGAVPVREFSHEEKKTNSAGNDYIVDFFHNVEWKDVEFPLQVSRPELIEATAKAVKERIFDSLGVLPTYRKDDPLIVGQINHWSKGRSPVTFFVAW